MNSEHLKSDDHTYIAGRALEYMRFKISLRNSKMWISRHELHIYYRAVET